MTTSDGYITSDYEDDESDGKQTDEDGYALNDELRAILPDSYEYRQTSFKRKFRVLAHVPSTLAGRFKAVIHTKKLDRIGYIEWLRDLGLKSGTGFVEHMETLEKFELLGNFACYRGGKCRSNCKATVAFITHNVTPMTKRDRNIRDGFLTKIVLKWKHSDSRCNLLTKAKILDLFNARRAHLRSMQPNKGIGTASDEEEDDGDESDGSLTMVKAVSIGWPTSRSKCTRIGRKKRTNLIHVHEELNSLMKDEESWKKKKKEIRKLLRDAKAAVERVHTRWEKCARSLQVLKAENHRVWEENRRLRASAAIAGTSVRGEAADLDTSLAPAIEENQRLKSRVSDLESDAQRSHQPASTIPEPLITTQSSASPNLTTADHSMIEEEPTVPLAPTLLRGLHESSSTAAKSTESGASSGANGSTISKPIKTEIVETEREPTEESMETDDSRGFVIPDVHCLLGENSDGMAKILKAFRVWKLSGTANWSLSLHSQLVLDLGQMKSSFRAAHPLNKTATDLLLLFRKYRSDESVILLEEHECDSQECATSEYSTCIQSMKAKHPDAEFVLLSNLPPHGVNAIKFTNSSVKVMNMQMLQGFLKL